MHGRANDVTEEWRRNQADEDKRTKDRAYEWAKETRKITKRINGQTSNASTSKRNTTVNVCFFAFKILTYDKEELFVSTIIKYYT